MEEGHSRRKQTRARYHSWVEIASEGARVRGNGRDISVEGIGVQVEAPIPEISTPVVSEFPLPGITLPLAVSGVVAWTDEESSQIGVRFTEMDSGLAELLASYVEGRL